MRYPLKSVQTLHGQGVFWGGAISKNLVAGKAGTLELDMELRMVIARPVKTGTRPAAQLWLPLEALAAVEPTDAAVELEDASERIDPAAVVGKLTAKK